MELHQLRYLVLAVDERSFSRAAEIAHVSVSAVSRGVQQLEKTLGVALLVRGKAELTLTQEGERLLPHARAVVDRIDRMRSSVRDMSGARPFVIGIPSVLNPSLPDRVVEILPSVLPGRPAVVRMIRFSEQRSLLVSGAIDLAVSFAAPLGTDEIAVPIQEVPSYLAVARDHPLAGRSSLDLGDLRGQRLCLLTEGGRPYREPSMGSPGHLHYDDDISRIAARVLLESAAALVTTPDIVPTARVFSGPEFVRVPITAPVASIVATWRPAMIGAGPSTRLAAMLDPAAPERVPA
ncbi:LysR family transcriptional regulator [Microbacterium sp. No. 7]|uniref:LysR family transcriptional regulator n=1 Tax=Microbacterium sp. No. 7 TaxID=1714373 RepID=UPI0006D08223|nr:LysR family transcriptional regulator [Microbacterium sp. No. 7]ALJ18871.1 hypothetical protein AOA12_02670 [Microbacterium sp. No. 7]